MVEAPPCTIGGVVHLDDGHSRSRKDDYRPLGRCGGQWEDRLLSVCCRDAVHLDVAVGVVDDEAWDGFVFGWLCLVHDIVTCRSR